MLQRTGILVVGLTLWTSSGAAGTLALPLRFEENRGQTDPRVEFIARGSGYTMFLADGEITIVLRSRSGDAGAAALTMRLHGARRTIGIAEDRLPGVTNYLAGADASRWRTGVAGFRAVRYPDVYPGIDLLLHGSTGRLEYDFLVAPGADPRRIELVFEGAGVRLRPDGALELTTAAGTLTHLAPVLYQEPGAGRREVTGRFVRAGSNRVRFRVGRYDRRLPLVIDPVLVYSTFLGGSEADYATRIAVDATGHMFVVGSSNSPDFPATTGALPGGNSDVFVAKLAPLGTALVYATHMGGTGLDAAMDVALDASGNAYICGVTNSPTFPMVGGAQPTFVGGSQDAFAAKLNATGGIVYSTFLGGSFNDQAYGVAVDAAGSAYVVGSTGSPDFPIANAYQPVKAPAPDAFVAKLSANGASFVYSTFLGGSGFEDAYAVAVDSAGQAYVTGSTSSANFPLAAPLQGLNAGDHDVFLTKFAANGLSLVFSTYLGGTGTDAASDLALGPGGDIYIAGTTTSADYPTATAFQPVLAASWDGFVTRLNAAADALVYSSYLGGANLDQIQGIAVDSAGVAYLTGTTSSLNFPTVNALDATLGGNADAVLAKIAPAGSLLFSSYIGGSGVDAGRGVATRGQHAYVVGETQSADFPTTMQALQTTSGGGADAFVALVNTAAAPTTTELLDAVTNLALHQGLDASLKAKLGNVETAIANGHVAAACGNLTAFINQITVNAGSKIPEADALDLIAAATALKASLGCP